MREAFEVRQFREQQGRCYRAHMTIAANASESLGDRNPGRRILIIVAIGLACINVAQWAKGLFVERVAAKELAAARSPRATIDRFHNIFYNDPHTLNQNTWLGIPAIQNPNDVWITQEILFDVKPDFVVEAGSFLGGGAVLWAMLLREINPSGRVLTIDIRDLPEPAKQLPIFKERVEFLLGSSTAPDIVAKVRSRVAGHKVVFILDSNHQRDHVLAELKAYADMVPVGCYIIVQDSDINGHPVLIDPNSPAASYIGQPGPMEAIETFLPWDGRFVADLSRERLMITTNPKGYLRRVK
jgi:cephalosporin hydroxylase